MTDLNLVAVNGRLVKDAEFHQFNNGSGCISVSIAVNRSVKKGEKWEDEASFFDVKYFTKSQNLMTYLKKGQQVTVSGSLVQENWEKDGRKNYAVRIFARDIQLIGGLTNNSKSSSNTSSAPSNNEGFPEDIPF